MAYRRKMRKKSSKRYFSKNTRPKKKNFRPVPHRGGYRL